MSVPLDSDEEEPAGDLEGEEGEIFELGDEEVDPTQSLHLFHRRLPAGTSKRSNFAPLDTRRASYTYGATLQDGEDEDGEDDLPPLDRWEEDSEDSGQEYKYGLPGTTPPKTSTSRHKKKKHRGSKNLSSEARVVVQSKQHDHHKDHQHKKRPQSMFDLPTYTSRADRSQSSSPLGKGSPRHARRYTVPDIKMGLSQLSKKERRKLERAMSPLQDVEEGGTKPSKKQKKVQRNRDRDDKTDLRQSTRHPMLADISRSMSIAGVPKEYKPNGTDYPDFMPQRSVTESLNPSMYRPGVQALPQDILRRTNSDAHLTLGLVNGHKERRCPPERKQFYRQLLKSIKFYGINTTVTNRLETPTPTPHRHHSENLSTVNPYSPQMDKLWMELQAYLRDKNPEQYEEWLFFNQGNVEKVLNKIMYFSCSGASCLQSVHSLTMPSREGYESLHSSYSSPVLQRAGAEGASRLGGHFAQTPLRKEAELLCQTSIAEAEVREGVGDQGDTDSHELAEEADTSELEHSSTSLCRIHHSNFLTPLQHRALKEVDRILAELDEIESYFVNRKKMGDEHQKCRTMFFKRRVSALILWQKIMHGLAENLCQLCNWLGAEVLLPDICSDTMPLSAEGEGDETFNGGEMTQSSHSIVPEHVATPDVVECGSPKSPKVKRVRAQFSVGTPDSEEGDVVDNLPSCAIRPPMCRADSNILRLVSRDSSHHEPYREFVSRALKRKGITFTVTKLREFMSSMVRLAKYALVSQNDDKDLDLFDEDPLEEERKPLLLHHKRFMDPAVFDKLQYEMPPHLFERASSVDTRNWMDEFHLMSLPSFSVQYMQLVHVPLDVMRECLKMQVELGKELQTPSAHTVKQLADECREILKHAIDVRDTYREDIAPIIENNPFKAEQVDADMEGFENDMKNVLKVYFHYLKTWVNLSSGHVLEEEWNIVKKICTSIRGGEAEAGRKFCDMVTQLLESMGDDLDLKMDEYCSMLMSAEGDSREFLNQSCRKFKELFVNLRERSNRVLGFAKILRKDLEIAADFKILTSIPDLFGTLKASDHVRVLVPHQKLDKMIFVPEGTSENPSEIQQLLNVSFARGSPDDHHYPPKDSYILLVSVNVTESQSFWSGKTIEIKASTETTINLSELQVDSLKMVVSNSAHLKDCRNSFVSCMGTAVSLTNERTSSHENVAERIGDLKKAACELARGLMTTASKVKEYLSMDEITDVDEHNSFYQSTMHACFNLGFEYVREVFRLLGDDMAYQKLGEQSLEYAMVWIHFVIDKCDRGRGTRPRWATTGLDFLTIACAPTTLATLSQSKFEHVKKQLNKCVDHVVGEAPHTTAVIGQESHTLSRMGWRNKKPWTKPKKLPHGNNYGNYWYSFSGPTHLAHLEDEEDPTSVYKLPETKFQDSRVGSTVDLGLLKVEEPPMVSNFDPSRLETAVHVVKPAKKRSGEGAAVTDGMDYEPSRGAYAGPQSPLSTIPSKSPPTSTDSLEHTYSSGVDSPSQSASDLTSAALYNTSSYQPVTPQRSVPVSITTPMTTPTFVERMDSSASTGSASRYYNRTPSIPTPGSVSRSDSGSSNSSMDRVKKIQDEIKIFEINRDKELKRNRVIGSVSKVQASARRNIDNILKLKQTNFKWKKGRKLGEGRFGKVYECFNLSTGEINAVKQISIQERDTNAIQAIIDEISNFQRLNNDYVVKFYGAEVHHNELYMFMEYCNEGTLWNIAQQGLTEEMVRHYTRDILIAVDTMHTSGIVHRDIKGANIFLSSNGSIKLGDFGLSVQLKNYNMTMPNEIKQQAGTVPYMAPEVVLSRDMGRPMDIWSVGCVVVEMATGKLPWAEYDNQWAIQWQLGQGHHPPIAKSALSKEGHQFLMRCFTLDVQKRPTAIDLRNDPFVMVGDD